MCSRLRTGAGVLAALTEHVRAATTFGDFMAAAQGVRSRFLATGAFKKVDVFLASDAAGGSAATAAGAGATELVVAVDEATIMGSVGSEYSVSGHATLQAKLGVCNLFGAAETLSLDVAGAPMAVSVGDLTSLGAATDALNAVTGAVQPSVSLSLHKPTVGASLTPLDVRLRSYVERPDATLGFSNKVREVEATVTDATGRHSLSYLAAWRNILPLPAPGKLFQTASCAEYVARARERAPPPRVPRGVTHPPRVPRAEWWRTPRPASSLRWRTTLRRAPRWAAPARWRGTRWRCRAR